MKAPYLDVYFGAVESELTKYLIHPTLEVAEGNNFRTTGKDVLILLSL